MTQKRARLHLYSDDIFYRTKHRSAISDLE